MREDAAIEAIKFIDQSLPVGWPSGEIFKVEEGNNDFVFWWTSGAGWSLFPGWLVTAVAALFGAPFLDRIIACYQEVVPLAGGWRERVPLHQLHPLLVHVCLFGAGYRTAALDAATAALSHRP